MRDIYNTHKIKGLHKNVEVYYPTNEEIEEVIKELIAKNLSSDEDGAYLDISDYDAVNYLMPKFTNLRKGEDGADIELKEFVKTTDSPIEPVIQDLVVILQICIKEATDYLEGE
jgi:hypothetical protein